MVLMSGVIILRRRVYADACGRFDLQGGHDGNLSAPLQMPPGISSTLTSHALNHGTMQCLVWRTTYFGCSVTEHEIILLLDDNGL
jgi:hypothetical protein